MLKLLRPQAGLTFGRRLFVARAFDIKRRVGPFSEPA